MNATFELIKDNDEQYIIINSINQQINIKYKVVTYIGSGGAGKVYKIENNTGKFIMKISKENTYKNIIDEVNTIINCCNKFKIKIKSMPLFYGNFINSKTTCITYPYFGYYNLDTIKSIDYIIKYDDNIVIIKQIIRQLLDLENVIHCDLKPSNIVLNFKDNITATIVDLGLLKDNISMRNIISTNYITSPESILTLDPYYKINNTILCFAKHDYFGLFTIIINLFINNTLWDILVKYLITDLEIEEDYIVDVYFPYIFCYMWYRFNYNDKTKIQDKSLYQLISMIENNYPLIVSKNFILFDEFFDNYIIPNINYNTINMESIDYVKILLFNLIQFCPINRPTLREILKYLEQS